MGPAASPVGQARGSPNLLTEECFGPVLVVVEYNALGHLVQLLGRIGPALTATVHADAGDEKEAQSLLSLFSAKVGRVVWNGYPTGVAVTWAMQHGGPYPATVGSIHTSVGQTAVRRWLRPICYQDVPDGLLPPELRDAPSGRDAIPRRVDGRSSGPLDRTDSSGAFHPYLPRTTTSSPVAAGRHVVRIVGRANETLLRWIEVFPSTVVEE